MGAPKLPLGQLLINAGLLDAATLDDALAAQRSDGRRLGELLVARGLVSSQQLAQLLSFQLSCPWVSLANVVLTPSLLALVPRELALKHLVLPVHLRSTRTGTTLYVATADPTDEAALEEVAVAACFPVRPMVAATQDLRIAIAGAYRISGSPTAPPPNSYGEHLATHAVAIGEDGASSEKVPVPPPLPVVASVPPEPSGEPVEELSLEADAVVSPPALPPTAAPRPHIVLVLSAPDHFVSECREAAEAVGAEVKVGDLMSAAGLAAACTPLAIVMTEDVYGFDRHGLNGLALDCDALLVAWSEDLEAAHLTPLLQSALKKRTRAVSRARS